MNQLVGLRAALEATDSGLAACDADLRGRLGELTATLYDDASFAQAEAALDDVADLLGMQWCWWTPDAAYPYDCEPATQFSKSRGWPQELMAIWRKHRIALYAPAYIRARFENLPFVSHPDFRNRQHSCAGYARANQILLELGITAMLHVPVHMPKGRIGLVNWGGDRKPAEIQALLPRISGELLAIGNLFMRNFSVERGEAAAVLEERSRLTVREWDCLRMLALGYREAEAAELLDISKSTLRFHVENVVRKFGCKNRTHAVAMAAQLGLLGPVGN